MDRDCELYSLMLDYLSAGADFHAATDKIPIHNRALARKLIVHTRVANRLGERSRYRITRKGRDWLEAMSVYYPQKDAV